MDSNRGWDTTSDEDDGMEIDLDAKQEDGSDHKRPETEEKDVNNQEASVTDGLDYDPAEPTDDYDPSEPTAEGDSSKEPTLAPKAQETSLVADYDPAEPTLSEEEKDDECNAEQTQPQESRSDEDKTADNSIVNEDSTDGRWDSQLETLSQEDIPLPKEPDSGSECVKDEGTPTKDEVIGDHDIPQREAGEEEDEEISRAHGADKMNSELTAPIAEGPGLPSESRSPSLAPTDTDDNTQMSFADGGNSDVPEVTIDESDFVLEKELFEPSGDHTNSLEGSLSETTGKPMLESVDKDSELSQEVASSQNKENREAEHAEKSRTQEEVDSRNEEALVDLFREESDPDRIENDLEQPLKKTKKKVGTKKLKKKGKKLKKGQSKKGQSKLDGPEVEDQRFVEIRGDRQSIESREEGEVDAGGHSGAAHTWGNLEDRLAPGRGSADQLYDFSSTSVSHLDAGDDADQREPGEIVEETMKRKSGKKRDRDKKKKKKSRREVATIEEGVQGDDDSQKFPSFLAGFFVQDEDAGEEDIADKIENMSHSFDAEEERTFQKGGKTYRKRHDSGAEDSVKSGEDATGGLIGQEVRAEEADRRKSRSHEERRHSSREHRHQDTRDVRDSRREKENRHGTPREKEREKVRDRDRSRHDRERVRDRENRDREMIRERDRERERSRRGEREERRRRHTSRSGSRERRRRSGSAERNRRSRSRERALRHRRHRSRSQERDRDRERARRLNRDRSRERESERRVSGRRASHSRSRSPRHRSERGSSNKENREESRGSRRRVVSRTHQEGSGSEERESQRPSHRRQRRERERDRDRERSSSSSSSSSSNSSNSSSSDPAESNSHRQHRSQRDQYSHDYPPEREHHKRHRDRHHLEPSSSDEGASSDVILVEPEKIVINLDEEEDPPSRVDITHANAEDDSTTMVDGESIPPPPDLTQNTRASALIEITQETAASSVAEDQAEDDQEEGDATPTRDERSDKAVRKQPEDQQISAETSAAEVGDYDPAHPTEEPEEKDSQPPIPTAPSEQAAPAPPLPTAQAEDIDSGPVPPSHPPPQEIRPSPPPVPAMPEPSLPPQVQEPPHGLRPHLTPNQFPNSSFSQPHLPPPLLGQQPRGFPPVWNMANRPNGPNIPGFPSSQRGLLPTPDTQPLYPSLQGRREQINQNQPPVPISAMAPLAQLTSLLPALERAKMSSHQTGNGGINSSQGFKEQFPVMKAPLMSNPAPNLRPSRGGRGGAGEPSESTEVVDMDMSPGEDDCELELPSPHSSDSDREERRRRGRKSDSHTSRAANDMSKGAGGPAGKAGGPIQPVVYLKALRKVIEKMTPKGQPSAATGAGSTQDKAKSHERRRRRPVEVSAEDDVPASAVELTNKEKYLKKLHLQERVIDEVKLAIKPFYSSKKINKDQYKLILRKAVPKVCHSKSERINPQKIQQLVEAYVGKLAKGSTLGGGHSGHSGKRKKGVNNSNSGAQNKDVPAGAGAAPHAGRQNGDRGKKSNR
ncbi:PHD and RING finger domain-containing protein 1 [Elysia marginata]|uniref:PHD and RING finger domain-containing protein 1 n=1 Tax=Elysia marginata TaxID=1093978 RepID=A0AAV4G4B8_9GAST|nr:PHD and RING finger domain-containing protein 1 [Elysia marginata]